MRYPVTGPQSRPVTEPVAKTDSLQDILARFDRYHPARIDLTLDRTRRLLTALGEPQQKLPPVIHVAGTNGKGSTIAFLRAIYEAAGLAVSTYTSPHLVDFTERFVLAGETISTAALCDLLNEVDDINDGQPITEFEIVTAAAFLALSRCEADVVLLETGLGGRYDATNMVDAPLATVITPISLDHQAFLGDDIAAIAAEKAAIQKAGVPSIIAPQPGVAAQVIDRIGAERGAIAFRAGQEWSFETVDNGFIYRSPATTLKLPLPSLFGAHQIVNAATAVACAAQSAQIAVAEKAMVTGLSAVQWPGRFQRLPDGALRQRLPAAWEVWLDAGHNGAAGAALAAALRQINAGEARSLHIVFGMLEDKDPVAFLGPLAGLASSVTAVPLADEPRSHNSKASAAALADAGIAADWAPSLDAALDALAVTQGDARVLICGSHVIVGAALRGTARPL
ncbi:MAG: bifunctional folylpolyglutamate synthase/dihydrofolate synthase [Alphaproteobacteria bacterium]|nr:bifunctional folylpolyglutamate synthase/dihydrofolate synthase [Alphaproteobacteria bacterium]